MANDIHGGIDIFKSLTGTVISDDVLNSKNLNLHCDTFYTPNTFAFEASEGRMNTNHIQGVPETVALVALEIRKSSKIPFPTRIIFGKSGDNILKSTVINFLHENGYAWTESPDGGSAQNIHR